MVKVSIAEDNVDNVSFILSNSVFVAVEIGLFKSLVLSTFPNPICAFVTSWGLILSAIWEFNVESVESILEERLFSTPFALSASSLIALDKVELTELIEFVKVVDNEEMADVLMYYNDVMLCYGISADELKQAYIAKFEKNMTRW